MIIVYSIVLICIDISLSPTKTGTDFEAQFQGQS